MKKKRIPTLCIKIEMKIKKIESFNLPNIKKENDKNSIDIINPCLIAPEVDIIIG